MLGKDWFFGPLAGDTRFIVFSAQDSPLLLRQFNDLDDTTAWIREHIADDEVSMTTSPRWKAPSDSAMKTRRKGLVC